MSDSKPPNPVRHNPFQKHLCCPSCGKELVTAHEKHENICGELKCRGPWLQRKVAAENEEIRAKQAALLEGARERLRETSPDVFSRTESGELRLIVVPDFDAEMAQQSDERIAAFRSMLEELMVEAQATTQNAYRVKYLLSGYEPRDKDQSYC